MDREACCSPWGHKKLDKTDWLNWTDWRIVYHLQTMTVLIFCARQSLLSNSSEWTSLSCSWSWQKCFVFHQGECCLLVAYHRWPLCWGRFPLCPPSVVFVCQFCQKLFLHLLEMIISFSFFSLFIWCVTLIELHILKNPCIPGINLTWSWCTNLLMGCQIQFGSILLRIFVSKMCHILKHLVKKIWVLSIMMLQIPCSEWQGTVQKKIKSTICLDSAINILT